MSTRVDDFLAHYASKYYDPAKAREYYLRTRELKGDQPELSEESRQRQREATAYVSNEIRKNRDAGLNANDQAQKALSLAAENRAKAHAARMEKLQQQATQEREKLVKKLRAKIEKIEKQLATPEGATPKMRAFLEKQRKSKLGDAREGAKGELSNLASEFRGAISAARNDYKNFRAEYSNARRTLSDQRRSVNNTYRQELATERQNIKDQVR